MTLLTQMAIANNQVASSMTRNTTGMNWTPHAVKPYQSFVYG